jgi:hypothetical protein
LFVSFLAENKDGKFGFFFLKNFFGDIKGHVALNFKSLIELNDTFFDRFSFFDLLSLLASFPNDRNNTWKLKGKRDCFDMCLEHEFKMFLVLICRRRHFRCDEMVSEFRLNDKVEMIMLRKNNFSQF